MGVEVSSSQIMSVHPFLFFVAVIVLLWIGTLLGGHLRSRRQGSLAEESGSFKTLEGAVLALLGLLLGFTFSMAVSRYDQRKNLEITEAHDIANVWLRSSTLPEPVRAAEQALLVLYLPVRLEFLNAGTDRRRIDASLARTDALQVQMWTVASRYVNGQRDSVSAQYLDALTAMNNITESRTAAFENRIPIAAWSMLLFIAFIASALVGIGISTRSHALRLILPLVVAAALSLTLDLDSPRSGLIRYHQHSLERVAHRVLSSRIP